MAVNVLQLRGDLAVLLQSYLGNYQLANGNYTSAVAVLNSAEQTDSAVKPFGLELVIMAQPDPTPLKVYHQPPCSRSWTIYLKDWTGADASVAARLVRWAYPGSQVETVSPLNKLGPLRQLRVRIPDPNPLPADILSGARRPDSPLGTSTGILLRYDLAALLTAYIGSYELANGELADAITVKDTTSRAEQPTRVEGMELVISRQPNLAVVDAYRDEPSSDVWTLDIKDWNLPGVSSAAVELICGAYPNATVQPVTTTQRAGPIHQMRVLVRDPLPLDSSIITPSIYWMLSEVLGDTLVSEGNVPFFLEEAP